MVVGLWGAYFGHVLVVGFCGIDDGWDWVLRRGLEREKEDDGFAV